MGSFHGCERYLKRNQGGKTSENLPGGLDVCFRWDLACSTTRKVIIKCMFVRPVVVPIARTVTTTS